MGCWSVSNSLNSDGIFWAALGSRDPGSQQVEPSLYYGVYFGVLGMLDLFVYLLG